MNLSTRVLLAPMPNLLRDVLTQVITGDSELAMVGIPSDARPLPAQLAELEPDVLVVHEDADGVGLWQDALAARPSLKVLSIGFDGRQGSLYELSPCRTRIGTLSTDLLRSWLRMALSPVALIELDQRPTPDPTADPSNAFEWPGRSHG